jgi:type IV secretory pathway TraG/TraD family ATPase VirD4
MKLLHLALNALGDETAQGIREQIIVIADALILVDPENKDEYWSDSARTVLTGLIAHFIDSPELETP